MAHLRKINRIVNM